mmetsp:Transcript_89831/g.159784  ORF Transcript_89831/g.159784 Transcript_89831/m.159784 type:complete len:232 (-) Transcript_89831:354-1049(-)
MAELAQIHQHLAGNRRIHLRLGLFYPQPGTPQHHLHAHPLFGVCSEEALDQVLGTPGNGLPRGVGHGKALTFHPFELLVVVAPKRRLSTEHDVSHNTQAPEIACRRVTFHLLGLEDLWRCIGEATNSRIHSALAEVEAKAPIDELDSVVIHIFCAKTNVLRFYVSMCNVPIMCVHQGTGGLPHDFCCDGLLDEALLHDAVEDLPALAVLHDEKHEATLLIRFHELANVGVV